MGDNIKIRLDDTRYAEIETEHMRRLVINVTLDFVYYICNLERTRENLLSPIPLRKILDKLIAEQSVQDYDFIRCVLATEGTDEVGYRVVFGKRGTFRIGNIDDLSLTDNYRKWWR